MSRDQRPGRVKLIDGSAEAVPTRRVGDTLGTAVVDTAATPASEPPPAAKSPTMLWSTIFLLACIAGAAGITLLPLLGVG